MIIDRNIPVVFFLGGPGSGKGTQCKMIAEKYGFTHLSTGNLLREEVASSSEKGQELSRIMSSGELVSNETVLDLLETAIVKVENAKGFLIDGYPREETQGPVFEKRFRPVDLVILLECSEEVLENRILSRSGNAVSKRLDDNRETLKNRITRHNQHIEKVLLQYTTKLNRINGEGTKEEVFGNVKIAVDELLIRISSA